MTSSQTWGLLNIYVIAVTFNNIGAGISICFFGAEVIAAVDIFFECIYILVNNFIIAAKGGIFAATFFPLALAMDMLRQCYYRRLSHRVEVSINHYIFRSRLKEALSGETFHIYSSDLLIKEVFRSDRTTQPLPQEIQQTADQIAKHNTQFHLQNFQEAKEGSNVQVLHLSFQLADVTPRAVLGHVLPIDADEVFAVGTERPDMCNIIDIITHNHRVLYKNIEFPPDPSAKDDDVDGEEDVLSDDRDVFVDCAWTSFEKKQSFITAEMSIADSAGMDPGSPPPSSFSSSMHKLDATKAHVHLSGYLIRANPDSTPAMPITDVNIVLCIDYKDSKRQADLARFDISARYRALVAFAEEITSQGAGGILGLNHLQPLFGLSEEEIQALQHDDDKEDAARAKRARSRGINYVGSQRRLKSPPNILPAESLGTETLADTFQYGKISEMEEDLKRETDDLLDRQHSGVYQFIVGVLFMFSGFILCVYTNLQVATQSGKCIDLYGECMWNNVEPKLYFVNNLASATSCANRFIETVDVTGCNVDSINENIAEMVNIEELILDRNFKLTTLPNFISTNLTNLQTLSFAQTNVSSLPIDILRLPNLKTIVADDSPMSDELVLDCSASTQKGLPELLANFTTTIKPRTLRMIDCGLDDASFDELLGLNFAGIETLDVSGNKIENIDAALIRKAGISKLIIANNLLVTLPDNLKLNEIDVSYNRLNTFTGRLPHGLLLAKSYSNASAIFDGNPLIRLIDRKFAVENIKNDIGMSGSGVECLDWSANVRLKGQLPDWIKTLTELKRIDISSTRIDSLAPGVFNFLTDLRDINLGFCPIKTLEEGVFDGLVNVTSLNLEKTDITALPNNIFKDLEQLVELKLDGLNLKNLTKGMFYGVNAIRELDFSNQQIETIEDHAFIGTKGLTSLTLSENKWAKNIPPDAFKLLKSLKHFEVDYSMLLDEGGRFDRNKLEDMKSTLEELVVSFDNLQSFSDGTNELGFTPYTLLGNLGYDGVEEHGFGQIPFIGVVETLPSGISLIEGLPRLRTVTLRLSKKIGVIGGEGWSDFNPEGTSLETLFNLFLDKSGVTAIEEDALKLPRVIELRLAGNYIKELKQRQFFSMQNLHVLDVQDNPIRAIHTDAFVNVDGSTENHMVKLRMDQLIMLKEIDPEVFRPLKYLEVLTLQKCGLEELKPNMFQHLGNLMELILSELLGLGYLGPNVFSGLDSLSTLSLENAGIEEIDKDAFNGLGSVETLNLAYNRISSIPIGLFRPLEGCLELNLNYNALEAVNKRTFLTNSRLKTVKLGGNSIAYIENTAWNGLNELEELYLQYNELEEVKDNMFKNAGAGTLRTLNLEGNKIASMSREGLVGLRGIWNLYLNDNQLESLDGLMFEGLTSGEDGELIILDVRGNMIEHIMEDTFDTLFNNNDGAVLDLGSNKLKNVQT